MAAIPPLAGFLAKEQAYGALVDGSASDRAVLAGIVAGSVLTVAYSVRLAVALVRPGRVADRAVEQVAGHAPSRWFVIPGAVLATGSVVLGIAPVLWSDLVAAAAHALDPRAHAHLVLWHGVTTTLLLSLVTLTAGLLVFRFRRPVAVLQARFTFPMTGSQAYDAVVRATLRFAARVTSVAQSGSLRVYVTVILSTAAIAPTVAMVTGRWWPGWPDLVGSPAHVPIAGILVGGAIAATTARRRFAAALLLGVVGYGMALLFVVQGAPDLALTQFAIETLSVVVFLLVFRVLPARFDRPRPVVGQALRLAVSAAVGVFVVLMAVASAGSRTEPSVSQEMSERALPEGDGRNIVNVILVDIRGLDTVGETTVLVAAGIGIVALARVGQAPRPRSARRTSSIRRRVDAAEGSG